MYAVCSKYCPTDRDAYLNNVEKAAGILSFRMALGKMLHEVVSNCLQAFIQRQNLDFAVWQQKIRWAEIPTKPEDMLKPAKKVWEYTRR
jgi:CRISPR/Cas system-associated exonuclease Cas4 (RecB family)